MVEGIASSLGDPEPDPLKQIARLALRPEFFETVDLSFAAPQVHFTQSNELRSHHHFIADKEP